ncbi:MAG: XTP/dITP diphosphatase [Nitrospiraceae bacterium]|nr:MAG: XTP/dITP diphosphatase [Nitrospiraceae bacterium]
MNIVLASKNRKKIEEIKKIFAVMDTVPVIYSLDDFPAMDDVVEDGDTFEANAIKKAKEVAGHTGMSALADDSGLEVDALDGDPGVYSARYAGEDADDEANNEKLLRALKDVPEDKRGAQFVCCIALASEDEIKTFMGYVRGHIGMASKGTSGFGYDPLFYPDGSNRTFAEMSDAEKNAVSHRAHALRELQKYLLNEKK